MDRPPTTTCPICNHAVDPSGACPRCRSETGPATRPATQGGEPTNAGSPGGSGAEPPTTPAGPGSGATAAGPEIMARVVRAPGLDALPEELVERFRPVRVLGVGGMGVVLLVEDRRLGREVALKLIREADPRRLAMFESEARILACLEHDNVVRLYEYGTVRAGEGAGAPAGDTPYLVMEYVRGRSLAARLSAGRPSVAEAVRITVDLLEGLVAAHERRIAHLDLKPANVFLEPTGRAKVADFGLSRQVEPERAGSPARMIAGTPGYMAPEQWRGDSPGPPADVYAAGVVLHEMLSGRRLFTGADSVAIRTAQESTRPVAPSRINPGVPAALDEIVASALAIDPSARPDAAAMRRSLASWLDRFALPKSLAGREPPHHPYRLLSHFSAADAPIFFGREVETAELLCLVDDPGIRVVMLFGPCGIGKSSLVRAGLVGALDPLRFEPLVVTSGRDPATAVLEGLAARCPSGSREPPPVADALALAPQLVIDTIATVERALGRGLVIVVDQLEELFTQRDLADPGARAVEAFFSLVCRLVESQATRTRIVLSYRSEFRGELFPLEDRLARHSRSFSLADLDVPALVRAVEGPTRIEGYRFSFEPGLPERLALDVKESARSRGDSSSPIVQIVCHQLHQAMQAKGLSRIDAGLYDSALGGADGALRRYVEERLSQPGHAYQGSLARQILTGLTVKEEGRERFARARPEEEVLDFPDRAAARQTLERLISDHLVLREEVSGRRWTRLASEVICPLVDEWQVEPDDVERAARTLMRSFRQWREQGRKNEDLLAGAALKSVRRHVDAVREVTEQERAFVARSLAANRRRLVLRLATSALVLGVMALLTYVAFFRPGRLVVDSEPRGARVQIDGRAVGETPLEPGWEGSPGRHVLTLSAPRHVTTTLDAFIPPGGRAVYQPVLAYRYGIVQVSSDPPGATCTLQGAVGGQKLLATVRTPFTTELEPGTFDLAVTQPGYVTERAALEVKPNRFLVQKAFRLTRDSGWLAVRSPFEGLDMALSSPDGAMEVWKAALPVRVPQELPSGPYRMSCDREGNIRSVRSVEVFRRTTCEYTAWAPPVKEVWKTVLPAPVFLERVPDLDGDGRPDVIAVESLGPMVDRSSTLAAKGGLSVLSGQTGQVLLAVPLDAKAVARPVVRTSGGRTLVLVVLSDGSLRAVDLASKATLWKLSGQDVVCAPVLAPASGTAGTVIVGTSGGGRDAGVRAVAAATGTIAWSAAVGPVTVAPAIVDGPGGPSCVVASASRLVALSAGRVVWTVPLPAPASALVAADLDGDGSREVAAMCENGHLLVVDREGRSRWRLEDSVRAILAVADLDGDRRIELAVSTGSSVACLTGQGGKVRWTIPWEVEKGGRSAAIDLDRDGAPELVFPGRYLSLAAHAGRDGGLVWTRPLADLDPNRFMVPTVDFALADLDSDGVADVVVASGHERTEVVALSGAIVRPEWAWKWEGQEEPPAVATGDVDGDGFPDVAVLESGGTLRVVSGREGRPIWTERGLDPESIELADLDGDGRSELLGGHKDGELFAMRFGSSRPLWARLEETRSFFAADLDADRASEVIVSTGTTVSRLSGRTGSPSWKATGLAQLGAVSVTGDLDRDRTADLAAAAGTSVVALSGATGRMLWMSRYPVPDAEKDASETTAFAAIDATGDGVSDVICDTPRHNLSKTVQCLDGRSGHKVWEATAGAFVSQIVSHGDLDRDGVPELLVQTSSKGFTRLLALSGRTGKELWTADTGTDGKVARFDRDVDGDGVPDVLVAGEEETVFHSGRTGEPVRRLVGGIGSPVTPLLLEPKAGGPELFYSAARQTLVLAPLEPLCRRAEPVWPAPR